LDGGPCETNVAPFDVRLPDADEADEAIAKVVQPDITVVCDPFKLDDRGCRGGTGLAPARTRSASLRSTSATASGNIGWPTSATASSPSTGWIAVSMAARL
jgi:hypothetical protein